VESGNYTPYKNLHKTAVQHFCTQLEGCFQNNKNSRDDIDRLCGQFASVLKALRVAESEGRCQIRQCSEEVVEWFAAGIRHFTPDSTQGHQSIITRSLFSQIGATTIGDCDTMELLLKEDLAWDKQTLAELEFVRLTLIY
jgi:hypothetical protein